MGFVDDRLDLLERERGAVDEGRVRLPHVGRAGEILGRVNLDVVDAVELRLAHGGAREPRAVDVLVLGESFVEADRLGIVVRAGGPLIERLADHLHARSLDEAGVDGIAQFDGVEAAARIHVEHRGEARREIGLGIGERGDRADRKTCAAGVHMDMGVDHAGHHGGIAEIDHRGARGNLYGRADIDDGFAAHEHHLVGEHGAGLGIEQVSGANGHHLVRGRYETLHLRVRRAACQRREPRGESQCRLVPLHEILPCDRPHSRMRRFRPGAFYTKWDCENRATASARRCINRCIPGETAIRVQEFGRGSRWHMQTA